MPLVSVIGICHEKKKKRLMTERYYDWLLERTSSQDIGVQFTDQVKGLIYTFSKLARDEKK